MGPKADIVAAYPDVQVADRSHHLITPGLIMAHLRVGLMPLQLRASVPS